MCKMAAVIMRVQLTFCNDSNGVVIGKITLCSHISIEPTAVDDRQEPDREFSPEILPQ